MSIRLPYRVFRGNTTLYVLLFLSISGLRVFANNEPARRCGYALRHVGSTARVTEREDLPLEATTGADGKIRFGIMYYPHYPNGGSPTCAHTKIVIDGNVYGTMETYYNWRAYESHAELAQWKVRNSFFLFEINVSDAELREIKNIVERGDASAYLISGCVQGSCKPVNLATGFSIPFPFNQIPSLAAIYLALSRGLAPHRVTRIQFVGKSMARSLLSPDIAADGIVTTVAAGAITAAGFAFKVLISKGIAYLIPVDDEEKRRRSR